MKSKTFYLSKNMIKRMKIKDTEWKKVSLIHQWTKLIPTSYKIFLQFNKDKLQRNPIKNGQKSWNRHMTT